MSRILIACDKLEGSLTAAEAARNLVIGLRRVPRDRELTVSVAAVADGGEGTVDAAVASGFRRYRRVVSGPTGRPVVAELAGRGDTGIVEMAQASGLARLPGGRTEPLTACSAGTGELMAYARRLGFRRLVLGLGGSAGTDGGAGMMRALGVRLTDRDGRRIAPGGAALRMLHRVEVPASLTGFADRVEVRLATDVDNPLLGPQGPATVYGPQKGASPRQVAMLEAGLERWASVVADQLGISPHERPGAGAAGGVGFAALAFLGARVRPGVQVVLRLTGFAAMAARADLIITGEGSLDDQTLRGKAVAGVAETAGATPVVAVAGRCTLSPERLRSAGIQQVYTLSELEPDPERSIRFAGRLLRRLGEHIGRSL